MSGEGRVHVVGAGLAGLAAAVALAGEGREVVVYEAAPHAGGRCRSFFDAELGCRIDNGNHLLLAGNESALDYLRRINALDTVEGPDEAVLPFVDLAAGERWTLRPNRGAVPWWVLSPTRRVPGTRPADYLAALRLRHPAEAATVAEIVGAEPVLYRRLWQPLAVAALNTAAEEASAALFGAVLAETLGKGGAACRPLAPREGLSETFVDGALALLRRSGHQVQFSRRTRALRFDAGRVSELVFDDAEVRLGRDDAVILAVPASVAVRLAPGLQVPNNYAPIVNAHFRCEPPADAPMFLGVVGGTAEWVFRKREVISVTVSAADRIVDEPADALRDVLWRDVRQAYGMPPTPAPPSRIVKERRATFRATPDQLRRRPAAETRWDNLLLAGDYVATMLPATMEGAIRSGFAAARCVIGGGGAVSASPAGPRRDALREQQRAVS
ncbi:MAG TPA: hydroxysqualene dehydroxylase HpnE [Stellaceae bacterium]|nr:hydroxysqualene dehydroxylase HpnE [Stellaceae bacterium]